MSVRPPARAPHRQPLLIGVRAYRLLAALPAAFVVVSGAAMSLVYVSSDLPFSKAFLVVGFLFIAIAGGALISPPLLIIASAAARSSLKRAIATRACDVVITRDELVIEGGQAHGFRAPLADMVSGITESPTEVRFRRADGVTLRVPFPGESEERASLDALVDVIRATALARLHGPPARREPPNVLRCHQCGAPQAPSASEAVRCPFCSAETVVPEEIAAKITALERVGRQRERDKELIGALVRQPGARAANVVAFAGGLAMWCLAFVTSLLSLASMMLLFQTNGPPRLGGLGFVLIGLGLLLIAPVGRALAGRRALHTLTLGFSAAPPERAGGPAGCRECSGPLPEPREDEWLSQCIYCDADNVRIADVSVHADIIERFSERAPSPAELLEEVRRARRASSRLALTSGAFLVAGIAWLWWADPPQPRESGAVAVVPHETERVRSRGDMVVAAGYELTELARVADRGIIDALLPGPEGDVTVLVRGSRSTRVVDSPRGTITAEQLRASKEVPRGWAYDRSSADAPLLLELEEGGRIACLRANGQSEILYGGGVLHDATSDVAAGAAPCSGFAATRASLNGHWRLRRVGPSGARLVRADARYPAVSPDGATVAAAFLDEGWRFQLAVFPEARVAEARWLTRGEGQIAFPVWSPDSRKIAFLSDRVKNDHGGGSRGRVHLFVVDLEGGLEQITDVNELKLRRPLWTERGLHVVGSPAEEPLTHTVYRIVPRARAD